MLNIMVTHISRQGSNFPLAPFFKYNVHALFGFKPNAMFDNKRKSRIEKATLFLAIAV